MYKKLQNLKGIQWFALSPDYGEEYGKVTVAYEFKREPQLLDIGKKKVRKLIEEYIVQYEPGFRLISDPDYQYSGGDGNKKYHAMVEKYFGSRYDGTVIEEKNVDDEDLEGATEIVLWGNLSSMLIEVSKTEILI